MKRIQRLLSISQPVSVGVRAGLIAAAFLSMVGAGALWGFSVEAQQKLERQRIIIRDGSKSLDVNMQGDVKLDPGSKNGFALGEGASLQITGKGEGAARRLDMKQEASGLKTTYSVNGQEKPLDAEGQAWLEVQINEIKAVEARKSSLAPSDGGTVQFEISGDGKDGADSKVIVYSNGRSPIILDGQPVLSGDLSSVVEAINKMSPEEKQKQVEGSKKYAKPKLELEELEKRFEEIFKIKDESQRLQKAKELGKEQGEKIVEAIINKMSPEERQKHMERSRKYAEEMVKQREESLKNREIASQKLRERIKEQNEKSKIRSEELRKQIEEIEESLKNADEALKWKEQNKELSERFKAESEDFRKQLEVKLKGLPAQDWKNLELFPGVIRVFPRELSEGPSISPEAKKRRIEEELKRAKARVEQLEEELKKSEAK